MSIISGSTTAQCPTCNSTDIDYDASRGDSACMQCGTVIQENAIVSEVGFVEDSRGRSNMIGQFVSGSGSGSVLTGFGRKATEQTISRGRRRINHLCNTLGLSRHHSESALRMYRMAIERNFHKGRRTEHVISACLYCICRREKTPHMLIDFSDILEINIYKLADTFQKFIKLICINVPLLDPSLYIHKFASRLEFPEDKKHAVAMSALRLVSRMKRDWVSVGRKPSGLCGAALIIAARMHGFYRSFADVSRVVRVGSYALQKRLAEIENTPSARLTAEQIDNGGGHDGVNSLREDAPPCDPPAFKANAKMLKEKVGEEEEGSDENGERMSSPAKRPRTRLILDDAEEDTEKTAQESSANGSTKTGVDDQVMCDIGGEGKGEARAESDEKKLVDEEDGLSDLDDEELESYINNPEECKMKDTFWSEMNKVYLEEREKEERLKEEDPEEYYKRNPWKRQKNSKQKGPKKARPKNAVEAVEMAVGEKASKKLNYDVLKSLVGNETDDGSEAIEIEDDSVSKSEATFSYTSSFVRSRRR